MPELTMQTRTIELSGGKHAHLALVEGGARGTPVLAISRSFEDGIGALLEPDPPQLVLPATCIPELVDALRELEGGSA